VKTIFMQSTVLTDAQQFHDNDWGGLARFRSGLTESSVTISATLSLLRAAAVQKIKPQTSRKVAKNSAARLSASMADVQTMSG
jgi:hypothetical protein